MKKRCIKGKKTRKNNKAKKKVLSVLLFISVASALVASSDCIVNGITKGREVFCDIAESVYAKTTTMSAVTMTEKNIRKNAITAYDCSLSEYASKQYKQTSSYKKSIYKKVLKTSNDSTGGFQYLRIDEFRDVDEDSYNSVYKSMISSYAASVGVDIDDSVLYTQADVVIAAAKKYDIDPVYFACQTMLESAYGTSNLANGYTINKVALKSFSTDSNGKLYTKNIGKSVKVYNLYGIKAIDTDAVVGATSYAYYQGWTSVKKAIYGAAKYLCDNYIYSKYSQNTIFKLRYNPDTDCIWHQYATDAYYASSIGKKVEKMSEAYAYGEVLTFDKPDYE